MKLIPEWRDAWRWYSVQATAIGVAWYGLSPDIKQAVPPEWHGWIEIGIFAAIFLGRVLDQGGET